MEEITGLAIVNRIDEKLKERGEKRKSVADAVGISLQPFTSWAKRGSIPGADTAYYIANYLNVSVEWLLTGKEEDAPHLGDWEKELLEACAPFDQRDKEDLLQTARAKHDRYTSSSETKMA